MAVLKVHVINQRLDTRIAYVNNPEKTLCAGFHSVYGIKDTLTSGFNCSCDEAYSQMLETKEHFRKKDKVQGFHFIQSFKPGETTPEQAHQIGCEFIERCFGNDFEVVIGTHTDRAHIHNHIIVNSVSFVDGHKYQSTPATLYELRGISDELCLEHGLSVIENPSVKSGKHYAEWKAEKEKLPTMRGMIREDIDVILAQARTIDEFWDMLRGRGYEIRLNERRKYVTIRHPNGERFIRLKSLGEEYTPRQLAARIEAQRGSVSQNIKRVHTQRQQLDRRKKYYAGPHTAAPQKRKKLHGFRALYWRYLYMLGKVKKRQAPRRVRGEMLEELKKLERYKKSSIISCVITVCKPGKMSPCSRTRLQTKWTSLWTGAHGFMRTAGKQDRIRRPYAQKRKNYRRVARPAERTAYMRCYSNRSTRNIGTAGCSQCRTKARQIENDGRRSI